MKCRSNQLAAQLRTAIPKVTLISGSEPMLVQQAVNAIRKAAWANGCTEHMHKLLLVDSELEQVLAETTTGSLFATKRLCEVNCQFERNNAAISQMLLKLAEAGESNTLVLIVTNKLDKAAATKPWVKYIEKNGVWVEIWPLSEQEHVSWLNARLTRHQLSIDPEALHILTEFTLGNLSSADQEIRKLALLHQPQYQLSKKDILDATADSARFTLYKLIDSALEGNIERTMHSWQMLQLGGGSSINHEVSALINRTLHELLQLAAAIVEQRDRREIFRKLRLFPSKQAVYEKALRRLKHSQIIRLMRHASALDGLIKGMRKGDVDLAIQALLVALCGKPSPGLYQLSPLAPAP